MTIHPKVLPLAGFVAAMLLEFAAVASGAGSAGAMTGSVTGAATGAATGACAAAGLP